MKKVAQIAVKLGLAVAVAAAPALALAAPIPLTTNFNYSSSNPHDFIYTGEIDIQEMARMALELQKSFVIDTSRYIPAYDMPTYSSSHSEVANKILKQTVQTWIETEGADLAIVRGVQKIDDALSTDIAIGSSSSDSRSDSLGKFKLRFRPVSSEAQVRYEGSFNANLSYNVSDSSTKLTIAWYY